MSRTKRLFVPLSPYEQQAMETLLEKQAAQGWLLTKMGSWFWTFEKTDPRPLQFAVTYFSRATEYDPLPTDGQQDKERCAPRAVGIWPPDGMICRYFTPPMPTPCPWRPTWWCGWKASTGPWSA